MIYLLIHGENYSNSVKDKCSKLHKDLPKLIEENLNDVEKNGQKICQKELFMQIYFMIIFFLFKINLVELLILFFM